jgi:organic hydroperoxide reductase OsmC/OhrA
MGVGPPPQFGGQAGHWSPEHLFVASVASCLMTTFFAIARMSGVEIIEYTDASSGTLIRDEDRLYRMSEVTLRPKVVVSDPRKVDRALRLLDKAESVCLISRSIEAKVHLEPEVTAV